MKSYSFIALSIFVIGTSIFTMYSCQCKSCDDPNLVQVPQNIVSAINYHWEMIQAVQHSNNTATSSIQIIPSGTNLVNSPAADSVTTTIILVAEDTLAGIKCLQLKGGFGLTCTDNTGAGAIAVDGILPLKSVCINLTKCCLKSNRIDYEDLGQFMHCSGDRTWSNGGVGLTGFIQNCKGMTDTVFLTVNFH